MMFFGQKSIFVDIVHFFWYHHDGTPKRQHFRVDHVAGQAPGGVQGPFLAQNWPSKLFFFTLHPYNPHFWGSDGPGSMGS